MGKQASVWYGAVVRGDLNPVTIGDFAAVQDRAVVCTSKSVEGKVEAHAVIGEYAVVGPGAVVQSATVQHYARVGAGAVVSEGALVEEYAVLEAGAVVHPGRRVPAKQVWAGNPAAFVRELSKAEVEHAEEEALALAAAAAEHADEFLPFTTAYQTAEALGVEDADAGLKVVKSAHEARMREEGEAAGASGGAARLPHAGGNPYGVPWRG
jgi:carbonic anhydrase/acetyltransferase-like protein (isoleucine patch superfamily)